MPNKDCQHSVLQTNSSSWAVEAGYSRPSKKQIVAAAKDSYATSKYNDDASNLRPTCFPAPLVLPGDDLACEPSAKKQPFSLWKQVEPRVRPTKRKSTIFVAPVSQAMDIADVVIQYLSASFLGLDVRLLEGERLEHITTNKGHKNAREDNDKPYESVWLRTNKESFSIRTRPCPDGAFDKQMNINDLLKVAQGIIPGNSCALILLVDHDMFEDEEDDFICGLADPMTRVAIVSLARYHPRFDAQLDVDKHHFWPASHCQDYMEKLVAEETNTTNRKKKAHPPHDDTNESNGPLRQAVEAYRRALKSSSPDQQHAIWLSRICFTVSHELGHCFGLGHCVYYACSMQGSDSRPEDYRQPPYLCPVDLAKVLHLTGSTARERYEAILDFCVRHDSAPMFAAYAAWIRCVLQ